MADCCAVQRGRDPRGHSPDCPVALRGGALVGYARVSTEDQELGAQVAALEAAGCSRIFQEKQSGRDLRRPELTAALHYGRAGDVLVVTRLSRLSRSLTDLLALSAELERRQIELRSLAEAIDTSSPAGRLYFHLMGAIAEFQRDLTRENTREGLAEARANGRRLGRPPVMGPGKTRVARQMRADGASWGAIARELDVSESAVRRALQRGEDLADRQQT